MAGIAAPEPGGAVQNLAAVGTAVVHAARRHELARVRLVGAVGGEGHPEGRQRSEEHTSELQSLMRISYAVFCLKKKKKKKKTKTYNTKETENQNAHNNTTVEAHTTHHKHDTNNTHK